jgi:preprotein translocase subunit YajC
MLENLKKNDHVITTGGIYGVVTNIRSDGDEVSIRVDDTTNTKLRLSRSAIARVIGDEPAAEKESTSTA